MALFAVVIVAESFPYQTLVGKRRLKTQQKKSVANAEKNTEEPPKNEAQHEVDAKKAEEEQKRLAAEEKAKREAEEKRQREEAKRLAAEEAARREAEEQRQREEAKRQQEEARRKAEIDALKREYEAKIQKARNERDEYLAYTPLANKQAAEIEAAVEKIKTESSARVQEIEAEFKRREADFQERLDRARAQLTEIRRQYVEVRNAKEDMENAAKAEQQRLDEAAAKEKHEKDEENQRVYDERQQAFGKKIAPEFEKQSIYRELIETNMVIVTESQRLLASGTKITPEAETKPSPVNEKAPDESPGDEGQNTTVGQSGGSLGSGAVVGIAIAIGAVMLISGVAVMRARNSSASKPSAIARRTSDKESPMTLMLESSVPDDTDSRFSHAETFVGQEIPESEIGLDLAPSFTDTEMSSSTVACTAVDGDVDNPQYVL